MNSRPFQAVDDEVIAKCVSCGLCLAHCPTFRISGLDSHSPRGRIGLVDAVRSGRLDLNGDVRDALESCVQCMGCLPACPSGVRYDEIIHPVIAELQRPTRPASLIHRVVFLPLGRPRLMSVLTTVGSIAERVGALPKRISMPNLRRRRRGTIGVTGAARHGTVDLLTGCVMGEWFGQTHEASIKVLVAMGYEVRPTSARDCCGALHTHAGLLRRGARLLERLKRRPAPSPILVTNSAGCGAHLQMNGVATVEIMDFIAANLDHLKFEQPTTQRERVILHDACHSRNVLGTHLSTHRVLSQWFDVVQVPDDGLCCGAGGAYSLFRPLEAKSIVERKFDAMRTIDLAGVRYVSSGNPGCTGHLSTHLPEDLRDLQVVHPVELVARMLFAS